MSLLRPNVIKQYKLCNPANQSHSFLLVNFSHKGGYAEFSAWKKIWSCNGRWEGNVRKFLADRHLPYWLRCNDCGNWRQLTSKLNATPEFFRKFVCGMNSKGSMVSAVIFFFCCCCKCCDIKEYPWSGKVRKTIFF